MLNGSGYRFGLSRIKVLRCFTANLRQRTRPAANDRAPGRHRFQWWKSKPFVERWVDERGSAPIERVQQCIVPLDVSHLVRFQFRAPQGFEFPGCECPAAEANNRRVVPESL